MHDAQCLAGMAFSNALLGIVHSMAHKTGAAYTGDHIIHGCANAMYLPKVIKYNSKNDHEQGVGLAEAPRGALAHFIVIDKNRVKNYQMVVPTTWNASPRDENGVLSAYESALIGTPIYDPCLACAVHLYDEEGKYVHQVDTF